MIYDFTPDATNTYKFNPSLDGAVYNASVTWNLFGQRYYLNVNDQSGNLVLSVALCGSSTQAAANPIARQIAQINIQTDGSGLDRLKAIYHLQVKQQHIASVTHTVADIPVSPLNLLAGYFTASTLYYYPDSGQIVVNP